MKWIKKGIIFDPVQYVDRLAWMKSHAAPPVCACGLGSEDSVRIFFACRDERGRSRPIFIDVAAENPSDIRYVQEKPILELGPLGTFDDNGIMPSSVVIEGNQTYLYYIGWNPQVTVSYKLAIGLAVSKDGQTFEKVSFGPVLDRSMAEPYFNTAPFVIKQGELWRMWYVSCTGWKIIKDWPEPYYHIKYAESHDGFRWERPGIVCLDYSENAEAIGKPCIYREDGKFKMIYSYRKLTDYRTDRRNSYHLGYAESEDGIDWTRKDDAVGIALSESGWDSLMMEYATTYEYKGKRYLIYNGDGFGETGFGYAVLEEK